MHIFPIYFPTFSINNWRLWQTKHGDVMWGQVISTWRMEHSNHLQAKMVVDTLANMSHGWVFHRIPAANAQSKWFQQKWMQNIYLISDSFSGGKFLEETMDMLIFWKQKTNSLWHIYYKIKLFSDIIPHGASNEPRAYFKPSETSMR